jgi:hypothetical protein
MSPTAIDDPCRLFRPRPFPERLWAFLCAPATGVADRLRGTLEGKRHEATPPLEGAGLTIR